MESKSINQKEYLKKYLSSGIGEERKKKKKKKLKVGQKTVKIIDDDIDLEKLRPIADGEFDIYLTGEDAPQIAGVVDERGPIDFSDKRKWKIIADDEDGELQFKSSDRERHNSVVMDDKEVTKKTNRNTGRSLKENDSDISPPRRDIEDEESDVSLPRKNKKSKYSKKSKQYYNSDCSLSSSSRIDEDSDSSPPRKGRKKKDLDLTPPRKSKKSKRSNHKHSKKNKRDYDSDLSPPRKSKKGKPDDDSDLSPPRKSRKNDNSVLSPLRRSKKNKSDYDSDLSPPRKSRKNDNSVSSPPRRNKKGDRSNLKYAKKNKQDSDSDSSPPRKSRKDKDSDLNSPKRSKKGDRSDVKYVKKNKLDNDSDLSPRRRSRKDEDSDLSPPRRSKKGDRSNVKYAKKNNQDNGSDLSPPRKSSKDEDSDLSPPRKDRRNHTDIKETKKLKDSSKSFKKYTEIGSGSSYKHENYDNDQISLRQSKHKRHSPERTKNDDQRYKHRAKDYNSSRQKDRLSRWDDQASRNESTNEESTNYDDAKMKKTLSGKTAGLQDAKALREESEAFKKREAEMFSKLSKEITGAGQSAVVRDSKTGRKRDLEAEAAVEREKQKRQDELNEKYEKWGRGLKQVENTEEKLKDDLYEMSKPLARYADDADLDKQLREQEREGDPMLAYIRQKQIKEGKRKPDRPQYQGSFMPNRFGIKPGHRWDGVDRSNGYEKKWYDAQNAKLARQEEAYKWSTADM